MRAVETGEQRVLGSPFHLGPYTPRPPLQWGASVLLNSTTGRPPVPQQRELSEIACVQTTGTHLLTGSHRRSCRTSRCSPGRGRWPRTRRSAQDREEGSSQAKAQSLKLSFTFLTLHQLWPGGSLGNRVT